MSLPEKRKPLYTEAHTVPHGDGFFSGNRGWHSDKVSCRGILSFTRRASYIPNVCATPDFKSY